MQHKPAAVMGVDNRGRKIMFDLGMWILPCLGGKFADMKEKNARKSVAMIEGKVGCKATLLSLSTIGFTMAFLFLRVQVDLDARRREEIKIATYILTGTSRTPYCNGSSPTSSKRPLPNCLQVWPTGASP